MTPSNALMIVFNDYRKNPQAHEIIVVAFHSEVFKVLLFIFFPKEGIV
jgi:hypothetical protein